MTVRAERSPSSTVPGPDRARVGAKRVQMPAAPDALPQVVRSLIPARMDRLPWTRFHTRLIMALGTAWILDGLEITHGRARCRPCSLSGTPSTYHQRRSALSPPST